MERKEQSTLQSFYRDKLLESASTAPQSKLTDTEIRVVEIASKLSLSNAYFILALESPGQIMPGVQVSDEMITRATQVLITMAVKIEGEL